MTPKLTDEMRQALQQNPDRAVPIEDDQTHKVFFVYNEGLHLRATQALEEQEDHAAIREGIKQMEAGQGRPLSEVDADIRKEFGYPPRT